MKPKGDLASCGLAPARLEAERQVGDSQSWKARGNLSPRDSILHETVSRLQAANHVFLGSWTVDICQEDCSQRSAPQRRHMAHLRWHSSGTLRNQAAGTRELIKTHVSPGAVHLPSTWCLSCSNLGRAQNACPTESVSLQSTQESETEQLRPWKCTKCSAGFGQYPCRAPWSLSSIDPESTHTVSWGKPSVVHTL